MPDHELNAVALSNNDAEDLRVCVGVEFEPVAVSDELVFFFFKF